jgi:hypothetical protein
LPNQHPAIDQLIYQLEDLNPIQQPLKAANLPVLVGNWALVYASRGTVVTRRVSEQVGGLPVRIQRVWQQLTQSGNPECPIDTENGAILSIPLLGEITTVARGTWQPYEEAESANVSFGAFSFQPTRVFGITGFQLPKLTIPVLEFLQREALWITSYLDEDMRFGRGATGNLFVFQRQ